MDINGKTIWQQGSGDGDRSCSDVCLKWDVILNGPGYAGPWPDCKDKLRKDEWTSKKCTDLERFSDGMKDGDIVILRLGTSDVFGVGIITGDYQYLECFSDIDGWDLQHVRRVRWIWKATNEPLSFNTYTLKQGDTTQQLKQEYMTEELKQWLNQLPIDDHFYERELAKLPEEGKEVTMEDISDYLFAQGVASQSIEHLLKEIDELIRIANWYKKDKKHNPSEHETIAYLVIPLLRALGWTPQKMAIEWNRVDIALFYNLPRQDDSLSIVVEAKKKDNSCLSAQSQAEVYAKGKTNCSRLIVTDGLRYGIYKKIKENFQLYAYFNLTALRDKYNVYSCFGVKEAIMAMTPEWTDNDDIKT